MCINAHGCVFLGKQGRVNLSIDSEIVEKAKELGLNLSKVSENALKEMIRRIESPYELNVVKTRSVDGKTQEPRAGFDPAACCLRGSRSTWLSYRGIT